MTVFACLPSGLTLPNPPLCFPTLPFSSQLPPSLPNPPLISPSLPFFAQFFLSLPSFFLPSTKLVFSYFKFSERPLYRLCIFFDLVKDYGESWKKRQTRIFNSLWDSKGAGVVLDERQAWLCLPLKDNEALQIILCKRDSLKFLELLRHTCHPDDGVNCFLDLRDLLLKHITGKTHTNNIRVSLLPYFTFPSLCESRLCFSYLILGSFLFFHFSLMTHLPPWLTNTAWYSAL